MLAEEDAPDLYLPTPATNSAAFERPFPGVVESPRVAESRRSHQSLMSSLKSSFCVESHAVTHLSLGVGWMGDRS